MKSVALYRYPHFVFDKGQKKLWNPTLRKRLVNRPEERVRLQIIDYLTFVAGWSPHRITTEIPVSLAISDTPNRADILCYDGDFNPQLLVECKAESVRISEKTGEQIGRYNTRIKAPNLMVSNGRSDYFFEVQNGKIQNQDDLPNLIRPQNNFSEHDQDFEFWSQRGFVGFDASPELRKWLHEFLPVFWTEDSATSFLSDPLFLQLDPLPNELAIDHYYRIYDYREKSRFAFSFLATPHGGTRIIVILNQSGSNTALLVINPELILGKQVPNSFLFNHQGEHPIDLQSYLSNELLFSNADNHWIERLADLMLELQII